MSRIAIAISAAAVAATIAAPTAFAGTNNLLFIPRSAPTLGEVGLGLLVVLVGAVGGYLARRKK